MVITDKPVNIKCIAFNSCGYR